MNTKSLALNHLGIASDNGPVDDFPSGLRDLRGQKHEPLQPLQTKIYSGLDSLPESYAEVFQAGARVSFFLSRDWFDNFLQYIVTDSGQVRIYGVETEEGSARAMLPLIHAPRRSGLFSPKVLEGLSNYYTSYFAPVLRDPGDSNAIAKALAESLWRVRQHWDTLKLQPLDRDSSLYPALINAFRDTGIVVQSYFCFGNWRLDVAGRSYQEYLESLSSVLRKNIPYNLRRLERLPDSKILIVSDENGLHRALDDYETIYKASWKLGEATPEFIRGLAYTAARNGWLRLGIIYIGGEPAAAQLWLVQGGVASIYKIAYDERFAKLSVGTVLTAKLMERVIDIDNVDVVDYLSGEDEYKKNWMSHRREFWGIAGFNPSSMRGLLQIARHVGGRTAKTALKRWSEKAGS